MKKTLLTVICCVIVLLSLGEVQKGQWLVGGSAAIELNGLEQNKDTRITTISMSPDAGYFFVQKLAGGLRVNVDWLKLNNSLYSSSSSISVAPFVRYYWLPTTRNVNVLADFSYGWGRNKGVVGGFDNFNRYTLAAGPAVFLSPQIALEFLLQYQSNGGEEYNRRNGVLGLHVGFQVHVGKAKGKS